MMFDKNILEIVRNEDIPYKWLFSYGETHFQELTGQELERIFPDLYRWTKVAFQQKKSNALNLLYNLLWMDVRGNVLNWEYSGLEHYKKRLALRFQWEKEAGPIIMLSFLHGERIILEMLRKSLDGGILLFFEHPNTRDESVFCQMDLNTAAISGSERKELLEILMERITDKVEFVDHLLSDKHERENFFTVAAPIEKVSCDDLDEEKILTLTHKATEPISDSVHELSSDDLDREASSTDTKNAIEPMAEPVHELSADKLDEEESLTDSKDPTEPIAELVHELSSDDLEEEAPSTDTKYAIVPMTEPVHELRADELGEGESLIDSKGPTEPVAELVQELSSDDLEEEDLSTGTKVDTIPIDEPEATTQKKLDTKQDFVSSQPPDNKITTEKGQTNQVKDNEEGRIAKLKEAIEGEELLKMFLYLEENLKLNLNSNAGIEIKTYSAIHFALSNTIQENLKLNADLDWAIHKNKLQKFLGYELKTSRKATGHKHINKALSCLKMYK